MRSFISQLGRGEKVALSSHGRRTKSPLRYEALHIGSDVIQAAEEEMLQRKLFHTQVEKKKVVFSDIPSDAFLGSLQSVLFPTFLTGMARCLFNSLICSLSQ